VSRALGLEEIKEGHLEKLRQDFILGKRRGLRLVEWVGFGLKTGVG
jgi:hypothetical protein